MMFPSYSANRGNSSSLNHRRSCSVTDMCLAQDPLGSGFGWKPCLYYARGYCKNGTSCRFLHGLPDASDPLTPNVMGSPGNNNLDVMEQCQELLIRAKTQQQQQQQQLRLTPTSQLLASGSLPYTSVAGKCMNFLLQQQQQQNDTQSCCCFAARRRS